MYYMNGVGTKIISARKMKIYRRVEDTNGNTLFLLKLRKGRTVLYFVRINNSKGISFNDIEDANQYFNSLINFNFTKYIHS